MGYFSNKDIDLPESERKINRMQPLTAKCYKVLMSMIEKYGARTKGYYILLKRGK